MKTITLKSNPGAAITQYDDGTLNFTELCQATAADPAVMTAACSGITVLDPVNGLVLPETQLPEYVLLLQSSNASFQNVSTTLWEWTKQNIYKAYSAGQEDTATMQKRGVAAQNMQGLQKQIDDTRGQIALQEQKIAQISAQPPVAGPAGIKATQDVNIAKMKIQELNTVLNGQQGQMNSLQASLTALGDAPNAASNFLNGLFGNVPLQAQ
jgi:hypothetical protein